MLRPCFFVALVFALLSGAARPTPAAEPHAAQFGRAHSGLNSTDETDPAPEYWSPAPQFLRGERASAEDAGSGSPDDGTDEIQLESQLPGEPDSIFSRLKWLGLRHSSMCGRNAGMGIPLVGTSWLNRPYYFGGDLGTIWITRPINPDVTTDIDMFGGIFGGCDWDYYWGTELAVHRATPEIRNERARDADRGDRLMLWTASLMYYPWGDALFRPYWRCGIGATEIDYPLVNGKRRDEDLWTFPIGVGLKYPVRHWLAARAEFADQIALGNTGVATQHDLTLTFGLEWRFGARPRSYWPWNPSRHIW